ncbi:methylmalonyl-CoA epimerase [Virgibacillus sp. W0430]|uniref:methylmalonyl-CoA epimerase n=1 Tax=Virgibacillus sp. W0430 TaxID=3391580 RepID=UPI003F48CBD4
MKQPKKIAHIGIAVKRIKDALPLYTDHLRLPLEKTEIIKSQNVKVAFLKIGDTRIELLEPLHSNSLISTFIEKRGEGIHHIAFEVDNIAERIQQLKQSGVKLVDDKVNKGANNSKVAFLHPHATNGVLVELCQSKESE